MTNLFRWITDAFFHLFSKVRAVRFSLLLLLLSVGTMNLCAQNSQKVKAMKAERSELKRQIDESEHLLRSTKKDVTSQLNNLVLLDAQILERQKYVDRLVQDADSLTRAIRHLEKELDTLQVELTACKANYRKAMTFVSRNRITQSRWMFVLMAKDFRDLYRRLRYASQYSKYQRAQGEVIQQKELTIRQKKQQLESSKSKKLTLLKEGRQQQEHLEKKKAERKEMVEQLSKKQRSIQNIISRDKKKYNSINARIDRLIKEEIAAAERKRKEAERKRKAEEERRIREEKARKQKAEAEHDRKTASGTEKVNSGKEVPKLNEVEEVDLKLSSDFAANRGRLPVPITGAYAITSRYGTYNVDGLRGVRLENKGINITGNSGAKARSIFEGEVVTVANFGGSYTVIIRHGSYYSVYNHLSSVSVRRGQKVATAQTIGNVAKDTTGNCMLHFQLRKNTTTLNPQQWIK